MRPVRLLVAALVLALAAGPAAAYTIYLKDGSRIAAKQKYEVRGSLAIITLPSGTQSSMAADLIDIPRTEKANESRLGGTAMVIEGGQATEMQQAPPRPPKPQLTDLLRQNEGALRGPVAAAPPSDEAQQTPAAALRARETAKSSRTPFPDTALTAEILQILTARGASGAAVLRGTRPDRPVLLFETATEASVFKAILASSNALLQLQGQRPGAVAGFELVCESAGGQSGGRFELTPELADQIVSRRYEITRFYVENVQF